MATSTPRTPSPRGRNDTAEAPDAPLWGARYDDQETSAARRSRRNTSNPFSSTNAGKARTPERRQNYNRMTPPSPPVSPNRTLGISTPKHARSKKTARFATDRITSRRDHHSLMLTPVKTPRNITPPSTGASRTLVFQHTDPRDAMPTPRKLKSTIRRGSTEIFGSRKGAGTESFEIHTDWNARRPTVDLSEDNAFIGQRTSPTKIDGRRRSTKPKPLQAQMSDEEMRERVDNDEGMIFTFRGKKVFRPYEDSHTDLEQIDALGYRSIRRSSGRPALLDFARLTGGSNGDANDTDEEAVTDIEAGHDEPGVGSQDSSSRGEVTSQLPAVGMQSGSAFFSWARTKPESAKASRKREVEEEGSSTGAVKKAKNLL